MILEMENCIPAVPGIDLEVLELIFVRSTRPTGHRLMQQRLNRRMDV